MVMIKCTMEGRERWVWMVGKLQTCVKVQTGMMREEGRGKEEGKESGSSGGRAGIYSVAGSAAPQQQEKGAITITQKGSEASLPGTIRGTIPNFGRIPRWFRGESFTLRGGQLHLGGPHY